MAKDKNLRTEIPDYQTYQAPAYDEAKYRTGIDTSYYDKAISDYKTEAEKNRSTQIGEAGKTRTSNLRNAYIQNMQNRQALNKNLAMSGIRGGATETSNLRLANQYGQARSSANADYSNSVNKINQNIDRNIFDYQNDMTSRAEEYRQNLAQAKWQADREDSLNSYNAQADYWYNYYVDYYSGVKLNKLNKLLKKAQKGYDSATTPEDKLKYLQEIRGIQARRGVIRNKK